LKDLAIGCVSAMLGLLVGVLLMSGANLLLPSNSAPTVVPPPVIPGQPDVSVTLSAAFVNSQVQQAVRQGGLARQATISLSAPNIVTAALVVDARVAGQTLALNATVTMRVSVRQGRIVLTVDKVDVGGVSAAQALVTQNIERIRAQAEDQINRLVAVSLQGTTFRVINVLVTPSDLTLQLKAG
jgi:hypothetical protein